MAIWILVAALLGVGAQAGQTPANEELWEAARAGDVARVQKALAGGADVNAKARYDMTALAFAADKGHMDVVRLLLDKGATVNGTDTFYKARAIDLALQNGHRAVAKLLLERGSLGAAAALMTGLQTDDAALVKQALSSSELTAANLNAALAVAKKMNRTDAVTTITEKLAAMPAAPKVAIERSVLESYVGTYRNESGFSLAIALAGDSLTATAGGQQPMTLVPVSQTSFNLAEVDGVSISFNGRGGMIENAVVVQNNNPMTLARVPAGAPAAAAPPAGATPPAATPPASATPPAPLPPAKRTAARPWPAFRGDNAMGNGDGQGAVSEWNLATGRNVRWKTPVPGIAISSPIVWGDRVFLTTAVSSASDKTFRTGLYGDVKPVDDVSEHTWKILCLDKATGKTLWERTAFTGVPRTKRHPKSTQASSTPVTDGKHVVAVFGTVGLLAAWDANGAPLWTTNIGVIDSGWFLDPAYQWGHSSSPIIYRNTVILQADAQKGSYVAAYDLASGKELWRTAREEIPTWGTPTILSAKDHDEVVTNGTKIRGYDAQTGKQLWTLGPNSEVTVGTPVVGDGLVYVTGGYPPVRPVYAIRPSSSGDISLAKGVTSSDAIAWSNTAGTYIPTPIVYDGLLYTLDNSGVLTAYDAKTGERVYRSRVGTGGAFTASPVAADGRLFIANEDGDVFVVRAGRTFQELAKNEMKEVILSTPAISDGLIVIRTLQNVYAIGEK
jgi:outer membrane protein assembly factor BamB